VSDLAAWEKHMPQSLCNLDKHVQLKTHVSVSKRLGVHSALFTVAFHLR